MSQKVMTMNELKELESKLKHLTKKLRDMEDSWTDHFSDDPDDMYLRSTFYMIEDKLSDVRRVIQRVVAPVIAQGRLQHNSAGRYEIEGTDIYFTTGSDIEVLYPRYEDDLEEWIYSSVEHDGEDYYLANLKGVSMRGLIARVKK